MKQKIKPIQIIRAITQLAAFLTVPALFASVFSAIGSVVSALFNGTFSFSGIGLSAVVGVLLNLLLPKAEEPEATV